MQKRKTLVTTKPLFTTRTMSTTQVGFLNKPYVPPGKVKINRNARATSQNEELRLAPQMNPQELKKYTNPVIGRVHSKLNMDF